MKIHIKDTENKFYKCVGTYSKWYTLNIEFYDFMDANNIAYNLIKENEIESTKYSTGIYIDFKTKNDYIKFKILS